MDQRLALLDLGSCAGLGIGSLRRRCLDLLALLLDLSQIVFALLTETARQHTVKVSKEPFRV